MGRNRKYTDEELAQAVRESDTIADVLRKVGLCPKGGNYKTVSKRMDELGLDRSHFTGLAHLKGKSHDWAKKIPLSEILIEGSTYLQTSSLKKRLLNEGVLEERCAECGLTHWRGKKLSLHLEHKNGVHNDNRRENLELLCPNCHSLTPTYCRKKRRAPKNRCSECGIEISNRSRSGKCKSCVAVGRGRKAERPSLGVLKQQVSELGYVGTGRLYGVSDNAIRKWLCSGGETGETHES